MDTKRFLLAVALSLAVLIGWQALFPPEPSAPPSGEGTRAGAETASPAESSGAVSGSHGADQGPRDGGFGAEPQTGESTPPPSEPQPVERVAAEREQEFVIQRGASRAVFTNRGAQLVSFELQNHPGSAGGVVDLVRKRADGAFPFAITDPAGRPGPLVDVLWAGEQKSFDDGAESLRFEYSGPEGRATKSFLFDDDGTFQVSISVSDGAPWGVLYGPGLRNPTRQEAESRFAGRSAVYNRAGEIERVDSLRQNEPELVPGTGLRWIGLQDTYFLSGWIADSERPLREAALYPLAVRSDADGRIEAVTRIEADRDLADGEKDLPREQLLVLVSSDSDLVGRAYWGAKEYDRLASLPYGLERTVNLGFFSVIARPLLWGLRWIYYNVIHNYGWAIVLMTLIIRILLFPLTHKSFVSMQKMQQLNPKMQAIRQKYRARLKDKKGRPNVDVQRKMNEEIMGLYKSEGVNPAGGCLPMILQIPVFFAFYNLLSSAIELRHAPWILWIKDLSAMDPYYFLPVFMGACMLVQQKMMPATGEPMQRRIMMLMPFFITFICLKLPSGLALYWATSNLLGIAQQGYYSRLRKQNGSEDAGSGASKKDKK